MTLYELVLILHSYLRWVVVALLLATVCRSTWRWSKKLDWDRVDERLHGASVNTTGLQFVLGLLLYAVFSPLPRAFFADVAGGMKVAPLRFFGMEHALGMFVAVAVIHIGRARSKREPDPPRRHRKAWSSSAAGLALICVSIPWPGCASGRPLVRGPSSSSVGLAAPEGSSALPAAKNAACPPVYESRCAACHGQSGRGDGPTAIALNPPPRDLSSPTFQRYASDDALREVIVGGGTAVGLAPVMPASPDLSEEEVDALVSCVRSFGRAAKH